MDNPAVIEWVKKVKSNPKWRKQALDMLEKTQNGNMTINLVSGKKTAALDASILTTVIGQDAAVRKLTFFVMSHNENTPFPTILFTGSHGLGKTFLAKKIAEALGRRFVEVNCADLETNKQLVEGILIKSVTGDQPVTILFDESHQLSSDPTTALLSILNPVDSHVNYYRYRDYVLACDLRKINVIFATTDAYKMAKPLKNRCEEIYLSHYSNEDLFRILNMYCPDISITCDEMDLAYACRGRGRDTFKLSEHIRRYCEMENSHSLTQRGWEALKQIFDIYPLGLNTQEIQLMRIVEEAGTISGRNIAIRMGINEENVTSEVEIRPKELGLIESTSRGRCLTDKGIKYAKKI